MIQKCSTFILVGILFFLSSCGPKKIFCPPDNEPVLVPKNPDKQYATFVKKTDITLKGTIEILDKIKLADIDAGTKGTVTKLRSDLDQFSSRYQDILKGSFSAFAMTPCDKEIRKRHFDLLDRMGRENNEIEKMRVELNKIASSGHFAGADAAKIKDVINVYETNSSKDKIK